VRRVAYPDILVTVLAVESCFFIALMAWVIFAPP
jgi:hypothetical protein